MTNTSAHSLSIQHCDGFLDFDHYPSTFRPFAFATSNYLSAPLAQLDRASVYGTEGYWFEPSGVY